MERDSVEPSPPLLFGASGASTRIGGLPQPGSRRDARDVFQVQKLPFAGIAIAILGVASSLSVAAQSSAPAAAPVSRWERMDYGPFLQSSVTMPWSTNGEDPKDITLRGLTVRFGTNGAATFDTGLLRWSAAWTGGWLKLMGTPFDGSHRPPERSRPAVAGTVFYATSSTPGVSPDNDWRDPRLEPYIPLPAARARYSGVHVRGDQVVIEYTIGLTRVREVPGLTHVANHPTFVRAFDIDSHATPLHWVVAENLLELRNRKAYDGTRPSDDGNHVSFGELHVVASGLPKGARWHVDRGSRLILDLPASASATQFHVAVSKAPSTPLLDSLPSLVEQTPTPATLLRRRQPTTAEAVVTSGRKGSTGAAYEVDLISAPEENPSNSWMRFGGFDFFSSGNKAALSTWSGDVWTVSGLDQDLERLEWRRLASGLFQPLGLRIVKDRIYVLGRDQITRLVDSDGDGVAEFYECFANDMTVTPNFHEFALDLHTDPAGNFYFNKGAPLLGTDYWDPIGRHSGSVVRVRPDGSGMERFATGLRAPNGLGVGPRGEVTCADNEGIWTPVCRLNWVRQGGFYGAVGLDHGATDSPARRAGGWDEADFTPRYPDPRYDPPLCWLPFAIDNSAGSQVWTDARRFGPLSGQLLHLSYGKCRAMQVLHEEVTGIHQGGVVPLPWTFDSSAMRGRVNPRDGQLYVCGLKGWQTSAARDGAFHRVRFTGGSLTRLSEFHVRADGFELQFNEPIDRNLASDPGNWDVQAWNYKWSHKYGSDLYSIKDPTRTTGKKGELKGDVLAIKAVEVTKDGKNAFIRTAEPPTPAMQLMVRAKLSNAAGVALPLEYYGTVNAVPH